MKDSVLRNVFIVLCRRLVLWGILAITVLVASELIARGFHYVSVGEDFANRRLMAIYEQDPLRCFRLKPNLQVIHRTVEFEVDIYTNALGLRTGAERTPTTEEKTSGTTRILFLGPSFTFGWGVQYEQAFPTLTEKHLLARGHKIEVINFGTPAQDSAKQLCWLKQAGHRFVPDIVVQTVHVFPFAVASACPEALHCPLIRDGMLDKSRIGGLTQRFVWMAGHSALLFYGWAAVQWAVAETIGFGVELYEPEILKELDFETMALRYSAYVANVRSYLGQQIPVLFVYLPPPFIAHPEDSVRYLLHSYRMDTRQIGDSITAIRRVLSGSGAILVDTTPSLIQAARKRRVFYRIDTHLTAAGNEVVAATLADAVELFLSAPPTPQSK